MTPPPPITRSGAQDQARHELAKPIYHRHDEPLVVRALRALARRLDDVIDTSARHSPGGGLGLFALVVLLVVAVGVLVWRAGPLRRSASSRPVLAPGQRLRAADHRRAADDAERSGDWRTAIVERLRAIARELEERGVLDPRAGRTALELATEAGRTEPELRVSLTAAARGFDDVVYGGRPATPDIAATLRDCDAAVRGVRSTVRAEAGSTSG